MPCLTRSRRITLQLRLAKREASLAIVEDTYDELLANGIEEYKFDSTEGRQETRRRKLTDLKAQIDSLTAEIDSITRKLAGRGVINLNLRRF